MRTIRLLLVLFGLLSITAAAPCRAQASYSQGFDAPGAVGAGQQGPSGLIAAGFTFRNQSQPQGFGYWYPDDVGPQSGPYCLSVTSDVGNWTSASSAGSDWMILPSIPGLAAGDAIRFYIRQGSFACCAAAHFELRYSPSGAISTGSSPTDVGDFSSLLLDIPSNPAGAPWTQYSAIAPGPGRLAFRIRVPATPSNLEFMGDFDLDSLIVGTPPPVPFPLPAAGQTVSWTASMNPIQINGTIRIPAGGTVNIQPGVHIQVLANSTLIIESGGTVNALGAPANHIAISAASVFPPAVEVNGTAGFAFTDFTGQLRPNAGGDVTVTDSTFTGPSGVIFADNYLGTGFGRFERDTFTNSEFTLTNYTLLLRDLTLNNSLARLIRDFVFMRNIVSDGQRLWLFADAISQPMLVDDVTVRNVADAAGLSLDGGDFLIGPTVSVVNCKYPAELVSAGLLPGSQLPISGNVVNVISVPGGDNSAPVHWADTGIPYRIQTFYAQHGGSLDILPGATVQLQPGSGMAADPSLVRALGTKERPIQFLPAVPGTAWPALQLFYRIRHAIIDTAITGAAYPHNLGWGFIDSSTIRNCTTQGVFDSAFVRKTLFQANAVGANTGTYSDLKGDTNPNAFEGNGTGVLLALNATRNWWGDPSGPTSVNNPGGIGDSASPAVPVLPFRTTRPDFGDAPPVVDLKQHSFLARPGQKMILSWDARDDHSIVSQRVYMAKDGDTVQLNLYEPLLTLGDNLPGTQRSLSFTIPTPSIRFFGLANIRVEATDDAGQIGWDDLHIYLENDEPGQLILTSRFPGPYTAGAVMGPVCWLPQGINPIGGDVGVFLLMENSGSITKLAGLSTGVTCTGGDIFAPFASTDRARIVLSLFTGGGISAPEYYFSPPFTVRPDPRVGDAPPVVSVTSPAQGSAFAAGAIVPITWTASDDEFIRAVHIQASYDGGRTYHFIAQDLPGTSTSYAWQLPPAASIPDVRVKIIVVDRRFQDSSSERAMSIGAACYANCDNSASPPILNSLDFGCFLSKYAAGDPYANCDNSTAPPTLNALDFSCFLTRFAAGCT